MVHFFKKMYFIALEKRPLIAMPIILSHFLKPLSGRGKIAVWGQVLFLESIPHIDIVQVNCNDIDM
jgi:hypothetical protein